MVPLRWFSPHCLWPHVPRRRLPATTPPVLFRSVHETSTLPSRHLSGRETDSIERHGQLAEVGDFCQTEEFHGFCLAFLFPTQCRSYYTTDIPAGFCGSYESWLVFFFFPCFSFFWCLRQGFLKQETPSAKQPTHRKTHLSSGPQRSSSSDFAFICSSKALMASLGPYGDG